MNARLLKFALSALFLMSSIATVKATTYTVDNKSESAAQYTDLQAAVDAAQSGDTILVAGSTTSYGTITVRKKLTLIGEGYEGLSSQASFNFYKLNANSGPSGSYLSGFKINDIIFRPIYQTGANQADSLMDFTLERNRFDSNVDFYPTVPSASYSYTYKRFLFKNNIFVSGSVEVNGGGGINSRNFEDITFSNNIFDNFFFRSTVSVNNPSGVEVRTDFESASGFIIRNNLWTSSGLQAFDQIVGAIVENNIFYALDLIPLADYQGLDSLQYSLVFNNNITYLIDQDLTANSWFAVGADNQNIDPKFVDYPVEGGAFSYDHDYNLQANSPAIGAGVNGEDLGIYGGAYPWPGPINLSPKGPIVTEFEPVGSPSVPAGGTVEFRFKSKVNN